MKNLTQLPWSGKGLKAKNDNTLGRMRGGIRFRIGSMSLKNTSLFGVILALMLTLGVGEMWGGAWIGNSGINVNGTWYRSSDNINGGNWLESLTPFQDANLGTITSLVIGGQYDTWDDNKTDECSWNSSNGIHILIKKGSTTITDFKLSCYHDSKSGNNNVWKTSGGIGGCSDSGSWGTYTVDISGYAAGEYTIKATWFSPSGQSLNNTANFTIAPVVTFKANGGIGEDYTQRVTYNTNTALTANTFTKIGYNFAGWATSADGSVVYADKANVKLTAHTNLFAKWTENTFDVMATKTPSTGGTVTPPTWTAMGVVSGGDITATPNTGYTFSGWSVSRGSGYFGASGTSTTTATANTKFRPTSKNTTINATFTANSYTFTLNGNGGSNGSVTIKYDSDRPTAISGASRAGYSLNGYFTAESGGNKVINADGSLNDVSGWVSGGFWKQTDDTQVLYAQWTESAVYYTLNFSHGTHYAGQVSVAAKNTNTGVAISNGASLVSGTGVTLTATPETHYRFVGWYSNAACTSFVSSSSPYSFGITADTKLYAKVELMTTTITLNANGGSGGTASVTATHGSRDLSSSITKPTREGYTFNGWYSAESGGTQIITTFGYTTGSVTDWTENGGYWKYTGSTLTVYAHWTEKMSTLSTSCHYDAGDPSYAAPTVSGSATTVGYATTRTITATAAGTGYTFTGWTLTNCTRTDGGAATATSITIRSNGDGAAASVVANYAEDLSTPLIVTGGNKIVTSGDTWRTTADADNKMFKKAGHSTESIAYFYVDVAATNNGASSNANYQFKIYKTTATTGYYGLTADGQYWVLRDKDNGVQRDLSTSGANIELRADVVGRYEIVVDYSTSTYKITINFPTPYTVTYSVSPDGAGGAITTSPSVSSGGKIAAGTSVTFTRGDANAGYEWYRWEDGSGSELGTSSTYTTTINANTTVVAKYTENTYNVTATASAGGRATPTGATSMGQITGGDITATPNTGYNFKDWTITSGTGYFGASGTSTTSTTANTKFRPTAAATVKATFAPKTTTITLNNQDATTPGTTEVTATYDAAMPAITLPEKTGYTFGGYWGAPGGSGPQYYNADGSSAQNWNNVDATYTLYAKWTANGYTVTIDVDEENKGTITGATTSQSVTYGAALTTIPHLPTAAAGYGLDGYYTDQNGAGTKVINGDGTWIASVDGYTDADKKWIHADNVTLYAYYKQAEITELTLVETIVGTAGTDSITVTPVIAPLPAGTTIVCWEVQYSNGTALPSQPAGRLVSGNTYRFKAPTASATYRIQATLRSGADCGGGSVLSTRAATFQVAGEHVVTILYQDGDGRTLAASTEIEARPLEWTTLGDITPPAITGYTFVRWDAGDGVSIKNGEDDPVTTTTTSSIQIKATYDGTLKAVYNKKKMIFFNNTLGWSDVYVYFYNTDKYWSGEYGSGAQQTQAFDGDSKPYWEEEHGHMTQIEGTNVWYFDYTEAGYTTRANVVFTEADQHGNQWFYQTKAVRSGGHTSSLPMFVPINEKSVTKNETDYYNHGYWMNYPENTGYTLKIYNQKATAGAVELRSVPFAYSADLIMPLEVKVDLEAGRTYGFKIYRADGTTYGNIGTMTANTPNLEMTSDAASNCGLTTTAAGDYTFNLYYSDYNENGDYQYRVDVTYPVAANDYRIVYSDLAAWSGATHTAAWIHPSRVITKNSGSEAKQDTVSFFWAYGSSPALKYQTCTEVGTGSATWSAGTAISVSSFSSVLTETGVYNFIFEQPAGGASISLVKVEPYNGKYYIRTDCAGATKWANYRTMDHEMTYSDYAETNSGFSHYFAHWVTSGTNVKFTIANDYSPCVSDTLTADYGTVVANINAGGDLMSGNSNIRFMWNQSTNKLSRAYISGSGDIADRFLVLEGNEKMYDENGNALTTAGGGKISGLNDNEMNLIDNENFVYERTIQVNTQARARLSAAYNGQTQYFIGSSGDFAEGTTVVLLGGAESDTKSTMRIVYDFKTNRLVTAYMPSNAAITENLAINADIMLVREHQNAGQQLTFDGGSLSAVKTVYGVMRFNRWTLNNKSTAAGHAPVGDPKSTYERSLYWISFPFEVNLSDVFGFGTYGTHWIIEYYDGDERAKEGYWADSEGFWKYVTNRNGYKLEAGKGYILALDLDLMRDDNDSFWAHNIEQVELFFPSAAAVGNIKETDTEIDIPAHECTIAARPGMSDDRRKKDSHWNIIGVPSYANYGSELKDSSNVTITWNDSPATQNMPFLYEWNMVDNTYSVQSGTTYPFKSMHAYMVQYNGKLKWSLASATPPVSPVIARQTDAPKDVEFRIELQAGEKVADQTFVKMSTDEQISTAFDFNYDLSKQMNSGKANIYTMVEGYIQTAGNCLPMSEQTTVVPVGVKIAADGDYTFAIPEGTAGIGVTLIDTETGIRTNLSALTYTIALTAGTYDNRFVLEFSPIRNVPTEQPDVRSQKSEVSKVLIDGLLYIVRDNKMYDARGAMIMEK